MTVLPFRRRGRLSPAALRLKRRAGALAMSSDRAYAGDWRRWTAWLAAQGLAPEDAGDCELADYMAAHFEAGAALATVRRLKAGIAREQKLAGLAPLAGPESAAVLAGIGRELAGAGRRQARPVTRAMLRRIVAAMDDADPLARRDGAAILLAWHGALRRGELVGLDWRDFTPAAPPMAPAARLTLRETKGRDAPEPVRLPEDADPALCPIRALAAWRTAAPDSAPDAPMFPAADRAGAWTGARLSGDGLRRVLAKRLRAAGLATAGYSPHSLRAGWISEGAATGADAFALKAHSRHRSTAMVELYVRDQLAIRTHPTSRMR